ncbi:hypothetical protein EVAR_59897_1 [Eumeta japonica]|uniref:Uncharacterized protein n=1 Tax=Eumeta variegata TaxID=151549 RepID=A0A4C2AC89_EUMVA|nr:hypothetical protein EVAR_59897_1 [Eumeta japonica]
MQRGNSPRSGSGILQPCGPRSGHTCGQRLCSTACPRGDLVPGGTQGHFVHAFDSTPLPSACPNRDPRRCACFGSWAITTSSSVFTLRTSRITTVGNLFGFGDLSLPAHLEPLLNLFASSAEEQLTTTAGSWPPESVSSHAHLPRVHA